MSSSRCTGPVAALSYALRLPLRRCKWNLKHEPLLKWFKFAFQPPPFHPVLRRVSKGSCRVVTQLMRLLGPVPVGDLGDSFLRYVATRDCHLSSQPTDGRGHEHELYRFTHSKMCPGCFCTNPVLYITAFKNALLDSFHCVMCVCLSYQRVDCLFFAVLCFRLLRHADLQQHNVYCV